MPVVRCPNPACGAPCPVAEADAGRPVRCDKCGKPFAFRPTLDGHKGETKQTRPSAKTDLFPALPAEFGRYRVLRLLGKGGMGAVYLAEDSQLGRRVALKLPSFDAADSPQRAERFVREARSAAVLQHPNICTVFDAGQIDGRPFITMAYVAGRSLADEIDPDAPMPQRRAAEIARKIALALEHAHGKGTVHRDLKPANVMLTADGEPVVMDFGLAKRVADVDPSEAKLTREGASIGTPSYMSPEQVRGDGDIGPATDVYSLGVMLFEMLTGKTPYAGSMGVIMGQILHAPVPPVREFHAEVDARLEAICGRAMAKEAGARLGSMAEFAEALEGYATAPVAEALPEVIPLEPEPVTEQQTADQGAKSLPRQPRRPKKKTDPRSSRPRDDRRYPRLAIGGAIVAGLLLTFVSLWSVGVFSKTRSPAFEEATRPWVAEQSSQGQADGFVPVFNGKDLTGWVRKDDNASWVVMDGILCARTNKRRFSALSSQKIYQGDFCLRVETMLSDGEGGALHVCRQQGGSSYRITINSAIHERARGTPKTGSLHRGRGTPGPPRVLQLAQDAFIKPGEWFTQEVIVTGSRVRILVKGKCVVDYTDTPPIKRGTINLVIHSNTNIIRFRKIEIKELAP